MKKKLAALTISLSTNSLTIGQSAFAPVAGSVQVSEVRQVKELIETRLPEARQTHKQIILVASVP
jgi:hypothetical protein